MTRRGSLPAALIAGVVSFQGAVAEGTECGGVALHKVSSTNFIHRGDDLIVDCATLLTPDYKCSVRRRDDQGTWHYGEATGAEVCAAFTEAAEKLQKK